MASPPEDKPQSPKEQPTTVQESVAQSLREPDSSPLSDVPQSAPDSVSVSTSDGPMPLSRVGEYEILGEIGRGGMGVVFKARHVQLNRLVALKMLSAGMLARPEDRQRFETEAAAAAQLQNANIVSIYEIGEHDGQPYFSMEFIEGVSLGQRLVYGPPPGRLSASYLERMARAVHYAHSRGVIHRDLKPANILLDENDQPKITDFGLAKLYQNDSGQTRTGTVVGTPSYMAPEQANARKDIGPACDVYSLGALLYEMISGRPPFRDETALATLHRVANEDPVPPHLINPNVDRDLETICLKCLEKEPHRRYPSAEALADDLRRYLDDEPISARRLSVAGRTVKWIRRKPATAALFFVTLAALLGFALFQWQVAENERRLRKEAEDQTLRAEEESAKAQKAHQKVLDREEILRHFVYLGDMRRAHHAWVDADLTRALQLLDGWRPYQKTNDLRQWEWYFLRSLCQGSRAIPAHTTLAVAVAYHPEGKLLASAGGEAGQAGEIKIWDASSGKLVRALPQKHKKNIAAIAFSPEGRYLASAGADGAVRIWDAGAGKELLVLTGHQSYVTSVAFSADGSLLASAGGTEDESVIIWDVSDPRQPAKLHQLHGHSGEITSVAFSPTGRLLASAGFDETIRLWNADTGKLQKTLRGHQGEVMSVAFHPDGKTLVSGGGPAPKGGQMKKWNLETGEVVQTHEGLSDKVLAVTVSRSGRIAAGCKDGTIFVWEERRSTEPQHFRADLRLVYALNFSPDGRYLASAGSTGIVRIWNRSCCGEKYLWPSEARTENLAFRPDGKLLVAGSSRGDILFFDLQTGRRLPTLKGQSGSIFTTSFSSDGKQLAVGGKGKTIRIYDLVNGGDPLILRGHRGRVTSVAFQPNGTLLASAGWIDDEVFLWDAGTGRRQAKLAGHGDWVSALAFSPDGKLLASAGYDRTVNVWDVQKRKRIFSLRGHTKAINAVSFSPDGTQVASAGEDQSILIWDLKAGGNVQRLEGATRPITALAYHPAGRRLASVGQDRVVRLWDLVTHQEILQLRGPFDSLHSVAFSPDGWLLAAAGEYPLIHVWDAKPGK